MLLNQESLLVKFFFNLNFKILKLIFFWFLAESIFKNLEESEAKCY